MSFKNAIFNLVKTILSIFRVMKNLRYKNTPLTKINNNEIVILGTGPSLKGILANHMEFIQKYHTLAVNKFCTRKEYTVLKPKHYVLLDAVFSIRTAPSEYMVLRDKVFHALLQETAWKMFLYIPSNTDMKEEIDTIFATNTLITVVYFSMTTVEGFTPVSFYLYTKGYGMPFAGNVLVSAVMIALNRGYKKLILTGADLSMHSMAVVDFENKLCLEEINYYDKKNECKPLGEKVHEYYLKISCTFESFQLLREYANYKGAKIVNSSTTSFIDAFEKKEADEIFTNKDK